MRQPADSEPRTSGGQANLGALVWLLACAVVSAASPGLTQPAAGDLKAREAGRALYADHCASCHGMSGHGDGPAASSLRRPPTDLTVYARNNGGVFPAEKLRSVIDGRGVGAHGSVEMPVWGSVFKSATGGEAAARARIDAILAYLRVLQARPGH